MFEVFALKNLINFQKKTKKNAPLQAVGRLNKPTFYVESTTNVWNYWKIEHLTSVPYVFDFTHRGLKSKLFT